MKSASPHQAQIHGELSKLGSPDLISRVTDAVLDEVHEWQSQALERMYPIVMFDALRVKIRDAESRMVKNKAVYVVRPEQRVQAANMLFLLPLAGSNGTAMT